MFYDCVTTHGAKHKICLYNSFNPSAAYFDIPQCWILCTEQIISVCIYSEHTLKLCVLKMEYIFPLLSSYLHRILPCTATYWGKFFVPLSVRLIFLNHTMKILALYRIIILFDQYRFSLPPPSRRLHVTAHSVAKFVQKIKPIGSDKACWSDILMAAVLVFLSTIQWSISALSRFVAENHRALRRYVIDIIEKSLEVIFLSPFITNRLP